MAPRDTQTQTIPSMAKRGADRSARAVSNAHASRVGRRPAISRPALADVPKVGEGGFSSPGRPSMPVAAGAAPTRQPGPGPDWLTASAEHAFRATLRTRKKQAAELEKAIDAAVRELVNAADRESRWDAWQLLKSLHGSRTPETVARLERERGLSCK